MNDRELVELAAKAYVSVLPEEWSGNPNYVEGFVSRWNPLTDDGDALRLAVTLNMDIRFYPCPEINNSWVETAADGGDADEPLNPDPYAATRRAIVRAAAEIGKQQEQPR